MYSLRITVLLPLLGVLALHSSLSQPMYKWKQLLAASTFTVGINPLNQNSVYAEDDQRRFLVSYDRGTTWVVRSSLPLSQIRQIIVHPNDTLTIFCAAFTGDLLRSTDYGLTWGVVLPNYGIDGESIVLDPLRPDTMYAGNFSNAHIFRSTDRGATWNQVGVAGSEICGLAIRPDSSNILFAGTSSGTISKSTDGGVTWRQVKPQGSDEIPKIVIDRSNPLVAFASAFEGPVNSTGIWKTTNGGETWLQTSLQNISIWALDIDHILPDVVYAGTFSEPYAGVYRSENGGSSWTPLNGGIPAGADAWSLKVHPFNSNNVWLAVSGVSQSGIYRLLSTRTIIEGVVRDAATNDTIRNGFIINTQTTDTVNLGVSGGSFRFGYFEGDSTSAAALRVEAFPYYVSSVQVSFVPDSTLTVPVSIQPLAVAPITGTVVDSAIRQPVQARATLYGTASIGPFTMTDSTDADGVFRFMNQYISQPPVVRYDRVVVEPAFPYPVTTLRSFVLDSSGISFQVNLRNADVLLVSADSGRFADYYQQTLDSLGTTWHYWNLRARGPAPLSAIGTFRKNTVIYYTGNKDAPFTSSEADSLLACMAAGGNLFITGQNIAERNDSSTLVFNVLGVRFGGNVTSFSATGVANDLFGSLSVPLLGQSGANNQTSKDKLVLADSTARACMTYLPGGMSAIAGIRRQDGLRKTVFFGFGFEGIASLSVRNYVMQRILGYFDGSIVLGVDEPPTAGGVGGFALDQNYPNPFNPSTRIRFRVGRTGFVTLKVFDLLGREIATVVSENLRAGDYERTFDATSIAGGVYFYRLVSGGFEQTRRLLLLR